MPRVQIGETVIEMSNEEAETGGFTSTGMSDYKSPGEHSASDNVEEEGSPNDPIPDSGSAPSPS